MPYCFSMGPGHNRAKTWECQECHLLWDCEDEADYRKASYRWCSANEEYLNHIIEEGQND